MLNILIKYQKLKTKLLKIMIKLNKLLKNQSQRINIIEKNIIFSDKIQVLIIKNNYNSNKTQ